jgi:hypothetical protein
MFCFKKKDGDRKGTDTIRMVARMKGIGKGYVGIREAKEAADMPDGTTKLGGIHETPSGLITVGRGADDPSQYYRDNERKKLLVSEREALEREAQMRKLARLLATKGINTDSLGDCSRFLSGDADGGMAMSLALIQAEADGYRGQLLSAAEQNRLRQLDRLLVLLGNRSAADLELTMIIGTVDFTALQGDPMAVREAIAHNNKNKEVAYAEKLAEKLARDGSGTVDPDTLKSMMTVDQEGDIAMDLDNIMAECSRLRTLNLTTADATMLAQLTALGALLGGMGAADLKLSGMVGAVNTDEIYAANARASARQQQALMLNRKEQSDRLKEILAGRGYMLALGGDADEWLTVDDDGDVNMDIARIRAEAAKMRSGVIGVAETERLAKLAELEAMLEERGEAKHKRDVGKRVKKSKKKVKGLINSMAMMSAAGSKAKHSMKTVVVSMVSVRVTILEEMVYEEFGDDADANEILADGDKRREMMETLSHLSSMEQATKLQRMLVKKGKGELDVTVIQSVMHVSDDGDITMDLDQIRAEAERLRNDVISTANSNRLAQLISLESALAERKKKNKKKAKGTKKKLKALMKTAEQLKFSSMAGKMKADAREEEFQKSPEYMKTLMEGADRNQVMQLERLQVEREAQEKKLQKALQSRGKSSAPTAQASRQGTSAFQADRLDTEHMEKIAAENEANHMEQVRMEKAARADQLEKLKARRAKKSSNKKTKAEAEAE